MKRAISDGDIPNKDTNNVKEEQYAPIDINGLFERLAPCDGTYTLPNLRVLETVDDGEVLRHLAATNEGEKIKPLLPSSLRKAMEQKAREYNARPHIRSYSRTIYNMAEIGTVKC